MRKAILEWRETRRTNRLWHARLRKVESVAAKWFAP